MKTLSRENEINAPMFSRLPHQLQIPQSSSPFPISISFFFFFLQFFVIFFFHQQCLQLHHPNADSDLPPHPSRPPLLLPPANPPAVASQQLPIQSHPLLFVKSSPMKIKSNRSNLHLLNPNGTPKVKSVSQSVN